MLLSIAKIRCQDKNCNIYKQGKNWYCEVENIKITVNSYSYTIITAHMLNVMEGNAPNVKSVTLRLQRQQMQTTFWTK